MKCIILVGYMCVGKTTIGKALAKSLGRTFYDLDWYIEERFHKTVPQIFAEKGEEGFRDLEQRMLREVAEFEGIVLACGGGTPTHGDNMDYMLRTAEVVYLKADTATIMSHLGMSRSERPLLAGKSPEELREFVSAQLAEREPHYARAHHTVHIRLIDGFDKVNEVVQKIKDKLKKQG